MKTTYCVSTYLNTGKPFEIMTEEEYLAIVGSESVRPYVGKVYRGEISIDDVPEELKEDVMVVVEARIARWGKYYKQEIPAQELKNMIEDVQ